MNFKLNLSIASALLFVASQASAGLLVDAVGIQATSASASSNYGDPYTVARTIDQSDLSGSYVSGVTSTSVIDALTLVNNGNGWHGNFNDNVGSITFDLGGLYTLDRIYLFWMNSGTDNNIADFSVEVATDSSFTSSVIAASFGTPGAAQQRIDFSALAVGEFVRLNWTSLQGQYPGLNEFIAGGVAGQSNNVPEPASLALVGLGLLAAAATRKYKRK